MAHLDELRNSGVQVIWQTGKNYFEDIKSQLAEKSPMPALKPTDFIADMGAAYRAADLVISRAGASSISEFCLIGKPVILVPSPNVAEDHQTKNAMALVNRQAARFVKDAEAIEKLIPMALQTVNNDQTLAQLSHNIKQMALRNSAETIADEVIALAQAHAAKKR